MKLHKKNTQNLNLQEAGQSQISQEDDFHFPETEFPDFKLTNEIGLSLNNQSIHRQMNMARLLNLYPIQASQFKQTEFSSEEKSKYSMKTSGLTSKECFDFLTNNPLDEKSKDIPDVIWANRLGNIPIQSQMENTTFGLFSGEKSIFRAKVERHEK
jgi:hypothetical protein